MLISLLYFTKRRDAQWGLLKCNTMYTEQKKNENYFTYSFETKSIACYCVNSRCTILVLRSQKRKQNLLLWQNLTICRMLFIFFTVARYTIDKEITDCANDQKESNKMGKWENVPFWWLLWRFSVYLPHFSSFLCGFLV